MPHSRKTRSWRKDIWWNVAGMLEAKRRSQWETPSCRGSLAESSVHWRKSRLTKHSSGHKLAAKWAFTEHAMETRATTIYSEIGTVGNKASSRPSIFQSVSTMSRTSSGIYHVIIKLITLTNVCDNVKFWIGSPRVLFLEILSFYPQVKQSVSTKRVLIFDWGFKSPLATRTVLNDVGKVLATTFLPKRSEKEANDVVND